MKIFKDVPNFKFMDKRYFAFLFSGMIIAIGVILFFTRGFNLGVDFTGGTNIEASFREDVKVQYLRNALGEVGLGKSTIQRVEGTNRFFIKSAGVDIELEEPTTRTDENTGQVQEQGESQENPQEEVEGAGISRIIADALQTPEEKALSAEKKDLNNISRQEISGLLVSQKISRDTAEASAEKLVELRTSNESGLINNFAEIDALGLRPRVIEVLKEQTYLGSFTFLSQEMVGPQVGHNLRRKTTLATVWAMLGMLIYIAIRFRFIFGVSAVITLMHDVLVTLSFILLFRVELTLPVVAAILTIVGYSLNDTIVIFDRIRDNMKIMKRQEVVLLLDSSINQTLSRTIMTSLTTLLTVMALFFFGGEVIHGFSFTLMVGIVLGTYSTIFQSCAWLKIWEQKAFGRTKKK
jgi:preprotein translocase subunit SecF